MCSSNVYVIFAGVNGSGKSTLYSSGGMKEALGLARVNTDEIVRSIGRWDCDSDLVKAGKIAVKMIKDNFTNG